MRNQWCYIISYLLMVSRMLSESLRSSRFVFEGRPLLYRYLSRWKIHQVLHPHKLKNALTFEFCSLKSSLNKRYFILAKKMEWNLYKYQCQTRNSLCCPVRSPHSLGIAEPPVTPKVSVTHSEFSSGPVISSWVKSIRNWQMLPCMGLTESLHSPNPAEGVGWRGLVKCVMKAVLVSPHRFSSVKIRRLSSLCHSIILCEVSQCNFN